MRIMHISTRLILGGSQENTVLSCEGQADLGHTVSLVYGPIYGPEGSLLERAERHGGIECIETPNLIREVRPIRDYRCYRDLRHLIRKWKPDVVHTHSSKAGILGRIAANKENVSRIVHTIHGLAFHPYQAKWRNAMYVAAERYAAKQCNAIVCVADAMRDQALAAGIGGRDQYITVYSGMETERYLNPPWSREDVRRELAIHENDFVCGTIARLTELKGHDDLLDALGPLLCENANLKLLWVGDGWWRDRLMNRVREMGLTNRVLSTGLVPSEHIPKYLQAMDVLIHPSYREGLPRTVVQGLLSERPVIAYDVDGTREVCIDGVTGRLIEPGDLRALHDAVVELMRDSSKRAEMASIGREMCSKRFDAKQMVTNLEHVYAGDFEKVAYPPVGSLAAIETAGPH